jgi:AcrR family transcriptional regulator
VSVSARARPLPPDERRAALVTAALPLVRDFGMNVTTRQLAEASGVAEGTIFRVFTDKEALIHAAVESALDPGPIVAQMSMIDPELPLRDRLLALTTILQAWLRDVTSLMMAIRHHGKRRDDEQARSKNNAKIGDAVTRLLQPDAAQFRIPLPDVVRTLRALVFAGSHPVLAQSGALSPREIVDVLLDGTLDRTAPCC